jgi:hypothetical protein
MPHSRGEYGDPELLDDYFDSDFFIGARETSPAVTLSLLLLLRQYNAIGWTG